MGQPALRLVSQGLPSGERPKAQPAGREDAELVREVLRGERLAFEELYRRHSGFAFGLAVRLQGSTSDIEDMVHDSFLRAYGELKSLRDPSSFRSWLGSIVVTQVRMRLRRGRLFRTLGLGTTDPIELDSLASEAAGPDVRAELAQVYALLHVMPADERIAWTLRSVERHRLEEIAELTSCSLATVKRRIQRAERFLHEHFVSPLGETEDAK